MSDLNAKHLREFLVLSKTGNITAASGMLYISPQGLSKAIGQMEASLGVQLFFRTKNGLVLTPEGVALQKKAVRIVEELENVSEGASEGRETEAEETDTENVALEITNGEIDYIGMDLIASFMELHPWINVQVNESSDLGIMDHVFSENVDIGICAGPIDFTAYTGYYLHSTRHCLVINKNNPLSQKEYIRFSDLKDQQLIFNAKGYTTYNNNMNRCLKAGFTPNIVFHTQNLENAHLMASKGKGIVISIEDVCEKQNVESILNNVRVIPFAPDEDCNNDIYLILKHDKTLRHEVSLLSEYIRNYFISGETR